MRRFTENRTLILYVGGGGGDNSSDNSELLKVTEQYLDFRSMDVTFDMILF